MRGMTAPLVLDSAMNGPMFLLYVKRLKRGDIVVIGNLPVHKVAGVAEAIEAIGATLRYLPSHSPDLNPIELAFRLMKAHPRRTGEHTIPGPLRKIGRVVKDLSRRVNARILCATQANTTGIRSKPCRPQ